MTNDPRPVSTGDGMRARVIRVKGAAELTEAWVQVTRDALVPAARSQDGYRGYVAIYDPEAGVGIAVTLWDGEESEQHSDDAARAQREDLARAAGASTRVEKFSVAFAEVLG